MGHHDRQPDGPRRGEVGPWLPPEVAQLPPSTSVGVGQLPSGASASAKTNPEVGVAKLPREASKIAIENLMHISEDIRTEQLQTTAVFGNSDDDFGLCWTGS